MEKIDTDYKRRIWKIEAKLFNTRKSWRSSFNVTKCPLNAAPQVRINSGIYPKTKITLTFTLTLLLEIGSEGGLDVKIGRASN